jgi:hypothetical protein
MSVLIAKKTADKAIIKLGEINKDDGRMLPRNNLSSHGIV